MQVQCALVLTSTRPAAAICSKRSLFFLPFFQGYGPKGPQRSLSFLAHFLPLLCLLPIPQERFGFYFQFKWTKNIGCKSAIAANYFCLAYKILYSMVLCKFLLFFDRFLLAIESRVLSHANKSITRVSSFPKLNNGW